MATRIVEWKKPYTWWKAIEVTEDKVINLKLRDENNLIIYDNGDDEIYVDLQLPNEIEPTDAFPVWVNTGRVIVDNGWDKTWTLICAKTTSGDNIQLLYADDWTLWIDNGTGTFKQIYFKWDVDTLLANLRTYIDGQLALKQDVLTAWNYINIDANNVISAELPPLSRFLSIWNSSTWQPTSFPASTPFVYATWDYYLVEYVDTTTNYRPNGSSYTGTASSTVETEEIADWDVYIYDGTDWLLQSNHGKVVTFANIAWVPSDNPSLANALADKQNVLTAWSNIQIDTNTNTISATNTTYSAGTGISINGNNQISNSLPWAIKSSTAPSNPSQWDQWYDTTNDILKVYDGSNWKATGKDYQAWPWIAIWQYQDYSAMRWPAPEWFHVPLSSEWQGVKAIMDWLLQTWLIDWLRYLKLPPAGYLYTNGYVIQGPCEYWSSSAKYENTSYVLRITSATIDADYGAYRGYACPIRCFKDSFVVPTSSWTALEGTVWNAWIFWNQTAWLISITANWTTGYTMMDKNLWATVVYEYLNGDVPTEANSGWYFQWWNNYMFPFTWPTTTSTSQVDATWYWPWNYYSSSTFIEDHDRWDFFGNTNLWWWDTGVVTVNDAISNTWVISVNGQRGYVNISWWDVQVSSQANNILTSWTKLRAGTQANYESLWTYDNNTVYLTI